VIQNSSARITWKTWRKTGKAILCARSNPCRPFRILSLQLVETVLQAQRIQLADRKNANTALRAPRTAFQP
jgi:hypothetical protein